MDMGQCAAWCEGLLLTISWYQIMQCDDRVIREQQKNSPMVFTQRCSGNIMLPRHAIMSDL